MNLLLPRPHWSTNSPGALSLDGGRDCNWGTGGEGVHPGRTSSSPRTTISNLKPEATKRLIEMVNGQLSNRVPYKDKSWEWRSVMQQKSGELAEYLLGKKKSIIFTDPTPVIVRDDTEELRQKVMGIGYNQWKKIGV